MSSWDSIKAPLQDIFVRHSYSGRGTPASEPACVPVPVLRVLHSGLDSILF